MATASKPTEASESQTAGFGAIPTQPRVNVGIFARLSNMDSIPCFKKSLFSGVSLAATGGFVQSLRRSSILHGVAYGWLTGVVGYWMYCQIRLKSNMELQRTLLMAQSRPVDPVTLQPLPDDRSPALLARRNNLLPALNYSDNAQATASAAQITEATQSSHH